MSEETEVQSVPLQSHQSLSADRQGDVGNAFTQIVHRSALYLGRKQKAPEPEQVKQQERNHILKLFLALQVTGLVTGAVLANAARFDLLAGMGLGLGMGSVNFGVSLTLSSSKK